MTSKPTAKTDKRNTILLPVNPYRATQESRIPSVESVALGILEHPEILDELVRRLAWTDPLMLDRLLASACRAKERQKRVLQAVERGTFGEEFLEKG